MRNLQKIIPRHLSRLAWVQAIALEGSELSFSENKMISVMLIISRLALTEMRLLIAKLFYHFDVELRSESSKWVAHEGACCRIFREKAPLWVDLKPVHRM
jgi:hypothetical protein